jgi:hypothetical protein
MSIPILLGSTGIIGEIGLPTQRREGDRANGSSGRRAIGDWRFVICNWRFAGLDFQSSIGELRFSQPAIWFMFSPSTADNRSGEVCHAGVGRRPFPSLRLRTLPVSHPSPPATSLETSDFGPRTADSVSRHSSLVAVFVFETSTSDCGHRTADSVSHHSSLVTRHPSLSLSLRLRTLDCGLCISSLITRHLSLLLE